VHDADGRPVGRLTEAGLLRALRRAVAGAETPA